jgi:peptide subunit release factor 1 (eRF1)
MITSREIEMLLNRDGYGERRVLSVYLQVDQGRADRINRRFQVALLNNLRRTRQRVKSREELHEFERNGRAVEELVRDHEPEKKSLVIFADLEGGLFWHRSSRIPFPDLVAWERRPCTRPLIEAQDEHAPYAVVLTDRAHARLLAVSAGEVSEMARVEAEERVRRFDASGKDQMWSQMNFQRRADAHASQHLKEVARTLAERAADLPFSRVLLAGPPDALAGLREHLPPALGERVIGRISLAVDSGEKEIVAETSPRVESWERSDEERMVADLVTGASKDQNAVLGLAPTLRSAAEGRIRVLVYTDDLELRGEQCPREGDLFGEKVDLRRYLGGTIEPEEDLLDRLAATTVKQKGRVELVRAAAARRLAAAGEGLGAFLRF